MAEYDFSTLGSSDFEKLVCDLLNASQSSENSITYKLFKDGKDKGIDFLYSTPNMQYNHVGQAKHYYRTGYKGLKTHLTDKEVSKVKALNPKKYILATSVDLTVNQTIELKQVFKPYIKDLSDIYGKKNINQLLDHHQDILSRHFKLWFSDTAIMQKVLQSGMYYRTADFLEHELKRKLRLYVETPVFSQAKTALENDKFVIIIGQPGVGKSTLAEAILYGYIKEDYELLQIIDDVKEAEAFLRPDDSKQIVYFDDFLGSNKAEINKAQGSETSLLSIVRRVSNYTNKRLIFTTRTHILNSALNESEKLSRSKFKTGQTVFNLEEYDSDLKKKLLYNHIDEASMTEEFKEVLLEAEIVQFVTEHKNFNPRSIEFITDTERISGITLDGYKHFIKENFDDPEEIWDHAYRMQIEEYERVLLNTLLTFDGKIKLDILEKAYINRLEKFPLISVITRPFQTAITRLENGFVNIRNEQIDFFNPSLKDYLLKHLAEDKIELSKISNSIRYASQISDLLLEMNRSQEIQLSIDLVNEMVSAPLSFTRSEYKDHDLIHLGTFIQENLSHQKKDTALIDIIESVNDWEFLHKDYSISKKFRTFLRNSERNYKIQEALKERTSEIVDDIILGENDIFRTVELLEEVKSIFDIDFTNYNTAPIIKHLEELFDEQICNEVEWLRDFITDESEAREKEAEFIELKNTLLGMGIQVSIDLSEFNQDWYDIAMDNHFREQMAKDD